MKVHCKYDDLVSVKSLTPNPKNANHHPQEQIERLAKILKYQGWRIPICVSTSSGFVTRGHGRLMAAQFNKWEQVPVVYQDYEDQDQELADVFADNSIASWAELDLKIVNNFIGEFDPGFDIDLLGIEGFELEPSDKFNGKCDENEVPELPVIARTKKGDLYALGSHRLLCGDSTSSGDVATLMNGERADMVFTDPPYGMNLDTDYTTMGESSKKHRPVQNDDKEFNPSHLLNLADEVFLWGANYYCWHLPRGGSWVVWDKRSSEEEIGKMDGQFGASFELCWSKKKHSQDIVRFTRPTSFWRGDESSVHPTQKPVQVNNWFFDRWGKDAKLIVDLFLGSGSTLIACEKTNRKCYGMEIDPQYCDVIVDRWEKYTGKKAIKESMVQ